MYKRQCKDCLDRPSCGHRPDAGSHACLKNDGRYGGGRIVKNVKKPGGEQIPVLSGRVFSVMAED